MGDANTTLSVEKVDQLITDRINGELQFLDGVSWQGIFALSKKHRKTLEAETCVMSVAGNTHRFMCNPGTATIGAAAQAAAAKGEPAEKKPRTWTWRLENKYMNAKHLIY